MHMKKMFWMEGFSLHLLYRLCKVTTPAVYSEGPQIESGQDTGYPDFSHSLADVGVVEVIALYGLWNSNSINQLNSCQVFEADPVLFRWSVRNMKEEKQLQLLK
jgi:hypothetical protein